MPEQEDKDSLQVKFERQFEDWQGSYAKDGDAAVALRAIAWRWFSAGWRTASREAPARIGELARAVQPRRDF